MLRIDAHGIAVIVAHPDDETIGCGALLSHLEHVVLVVVTDGAPRDLNDARAAGFEDAASYAARRRRELASALDIAGCKPRLVTLAFPDQRAAHSLSALTHRIADILRCTNVSTVLTHAYEGGHPDHDATAFAVHSAVRLLEAEDRKLSIVEMPLYRLGPEGMITQDFPEPAEQVLLVPLSAEEQARKRRMIAAHASQQATLAIFTVTAERYRIAPDYDFSALPNRGRLLYERYGWGMTGECWLQLVQAAQRELQTDQHATLTL